MSRTSSVSALAVCAAMGWAVPVAGQSAPVTVLQPMILQPVMLQPVQLIPVVPVQVIPVQPAVAVPVIAAPVAAVPVVAAPPPDEGNMLSRLIAKIDIQYDNEIRNGPEGPVDQVNYRPPPEPAPAIPVVWVPVGPTAPGVYTVRSGGSLAAVAARTGARLEDLITLNPALPADRRLEAGTMVNLPFPWPNS